MELTQGQLAEAFGKTTRTIRAWESEGLVARVDGSRKVYDLTEAIRFYRDREVEAAVSAVQTNELDAVKLRKLEAEAEAQELKLGQMRGDFVPLDEVEDLVRESLEAVDSVLRHAPSRFAPALAKSAKVSVKVARTMLRELVESVRGAIREGAKEGVNAN